MNEFFSLRVSDVRQETDGCVSIAFEVPENARESFAFRAGQYLTLEADIEGRAVRRSYSLCSSPEEGEWRVAVKAVENGVFSTWANTALRVGDSMRVMPPNGKFILEAKATDAREFIAFAAGSGITPILSQIKHVLGQEPQSTFTLFYVNRETSSIMFREALQELKDRYMSRFRLFHLLTREPQDIELFNGRLDEARCTAILTSDWVNMDRLDAAYLCGPEAMIWSCKAALEGAGMKESAIKFELFTSSSSSNADRTPEASTGDPAEMRSLSIVLDGMTTVVQVPANKTIMDVALDAGIDAPYSCLGGVCCTCRAKMVAGAAEMEVNYALEPEETAAGFVLTCQSKLKGSGPFVVDYDQQ